MQTRRVFLAVVLGLIVVHTTVSAQVTFTRIRPLGLRP
jgi:hypothetical protein